MTGAVNSPDGLMEPAVAFQVTVVAKLLPVPVTVAMHWTTWPDWMVDDEQLTVTPVTVELLLEPQAAVHRTIPTANKSTNRLFISVPL